MTDTVLVRALASFSGGPKVGRVDDVDAEIAEAAIRAGMAVRVDALAARLPRLNIQP